MRILLFLVSILSFVISLMITAMDQIWHTPSPPGNRERRRGYLVIRGFADQVGRQQPVGLISRIHGIVTMVTSSKDRKAHNHNDNDISAMRTVSRVEPNPVASVHQRPPIRAVIARQIIGIGDTDTNQQRPMIRAVHGNGIIGQQCLQIRNRGSTQVLGIAA